MSYHRLNKISDAIHYYQRGIDIMLNDEKLSQDQKNLAYLYDQISSLYMKKKMISEAIRCYSSSLKLKASYYGNNHEQTAHSYISLGKAYLSNREYEKAYSNFSVGNHILEKTLGKYTIHSANCYVCMAQIKYKVKHYRESIDLYETALEIYINLLGKTHLYTYRIYLNLLYLSFIINDGNKIDYYERKLLVLLSTHPDVNSFIIYNEVANIFRKYSQYTKAITYYFSAIELFEDLEEKDKHYEGISLIYCNIASTSLLMKSYSDVIQMKIYLRNQAIKYYKIALRILEQVGNKTYARRAQVSLNLGKLLKNVKQPNEARYYLEQAEKFMIKVGKDVDSKKVQEVRQLIQELEFNKLRMGSH